jgi:hypothetical protein
MEPKCDIMFFKIIAFVVFIDHTDIPREGVENLEKFCLECHVFSRCFLFARA